MIEKKLLSIFFNKIKNFFNKITISKKDQPTVDDKNKNIKNINYELINKIKENDIIWVKMEEVRIKEQNISPEHSKRPFLITKKNENKQILQGYYCTSNINYKFQNDKYNHFKIILNENCYNIKKSSLLKYNELIHLPYENALEFIDHINNMDLNKLKKYRDIIQKQPIISNKENILIDIGDIIFFEDSYYVVYQKDNTQFYCYEINQTNEYINLKENFNYVMNNNNIYFINYKNNKILNNNDTVYIVNKFNKKTIEYVKLNKKRLRKQAKNKK